MGCFVIQMRLNGFKGISIELAHIACTIIHEWRRHTLTLDLLCFHENHPWQRPDAVKRLIAEIVERAVAQLKGPQVHQLKPLHL